LRANQARVTVFEMRVLARKGPRSARVVVVDDEPASRAVLSEVVEAATGTPSSCFGSGEDALAFLRTSGADLVLMDVRMPGLGGLGAADALRHVPGAPPVILISADDRPDIAADPGRHGAMAFLRKETVTPRLLRHICLETGLSAP
jgi:CheY-like chemotaxis protein